MKFPFEKKTFKKIQVSQVDFYTLDNRLGLSKLNSLRFSNVKNKINTFINVHNGNIEWYMKAIRREKLLKLLFMLFTVLLIIGLPVFIFKVTDILSGIPELTISKADKDMGYYSGYSVAILTSVFGFHKVLNSWLAKRKLLSIFQEASAKLKANLYAFEDRWNNAQIYQTTNPTNVTIEFEEDLEKTVAAGRQIADDERKKFYEHTENPDVDLGNLFSASFTQASGFFKNFQSNRFARKLDELEAERKATAEVKNLIRQISQSESHLRELDALESETKQALNIATGATKTALTSLIASLQTKKSTLLLSIAEQKSKL